MGDQPKKKKPYSKPMILVEKMTLDRPLANNCQTIGNFASASNCGYEDELYFYEDGKGWWGTTTVFADMWICDTYRPGGSWQDDGKTICVGTYANNLFSS